MSTRERAPYKRIRPRVSCQTMAGVTGSPVSCIPEDECLTLIIEPHRGDVIFVKQRCTRLFHRSDDIPAGPAPPIPPVESAPAIAHEFFSTISPSSLTTTAVVCVVP